MKENLAAHHGSMATSTRGSVIKGFTLLEVLLVIATIAVLATLLIPAINRAQLRGKRVKCLNNLKQIGLAFHTYAHDHADKFPMQVSTNAGGTMEFVTAAERLGGSFYFAFRHFQAVSNELVDPRLLICPADTRLPATNFASLQNENVSYFVAPLAQFGHSDSIVAGDRNITGTWPSAGSVLEIGKESLPGWTAELHNGQGFILFGDSRVELLNSKTFAVALNTSKGNVPVYLPTASGAALGAGPQQNTSRASPGGMTAARPGAPDNSSSSDGSVSGGARSASGGTNARPVGGDAFSQLEQLFAGTQPKSAPGNTTMGKKADPVLAAVTPPPVAPEIVTELKATNRPATTNAAVSMGQLPDQTPGDPWAISIGQIVTKFGSRGTWLLLLVILAVLVTVEILRRRRARKKSQS